MVVGSWFGLLFGFASSSLVERGVWVVRGKGDQWAGRRNETFFRFLLEGCGKEVVEK